MPSGLKKQTLWEELNGLVEKRCPEGSWPESVKQRGITNMELLKYIYALKPTHKYFSKDFDGEDEWRSDGSYSSEDSEFEAQFAEVVKDLPPNLAGKLPKRKVREYDDDDEDEEEAKVEETI